MGDTALSVRGVPAGLSPAARRYDEEIGGFPIFGVAKTPGQTKRPGEPPRAKTAPRRDSRSVAARRTGLAVLEAGSATDYLDGVSEGGVLPQVRRIQVGDNPRPWPRRALFPEPEVVEDPTQMCGAVVRAALEVLAGQRSAQQLRAWVTPQVLNQIQLRAKLEWEGSDEPILEDRRLAVRVRAIKLVRTGDQAEASVLIDAGDRVRAVAAKLVVCRGMWRGCGLGGG
ncbi:MAG: Rv3235 family protein, partial [Cellulomonadaceae bacterium]|nr:Rv3235 family protein [Cellulomonadaceae bacterium]